MKEEIDINNTGLKKNPFKVPDGYFEEFRETLSNKIAEKRAPAGVGFFTILRPQLALFSLFAAIFIIGYGVFSLFPGKNNELEVIGITANSQLLDEGFLKPTFVDFYDFEDDTLYKQSTDIGDDELLTYISEHIDIVTLASLD